MSKARQTILSRDLRDVGALTRIARRSLNSIQNRAATNTRARTSSLGNIGDVICTSPAQGQADSTLRLGAYHIPAG